MLFGLHFDGEPARNLNHVFPRQFENGFNKKIGMFMFKNQNDGATLIKVNGASLPVCTYFQDTGVLIFGGYVLSGHCNQQQISVKTEGVLIFGGVLIYGVLRYSDSHAHVHAVSTLASK